MYDAFGVSVSVIKFLPFCLSMHAIQVTLIISLLSNKSGLFVKLLKREDISPLLFEHCILPCISINRYLLNTNPIFSSFPSFKASFSPFRKTQSSFNGLSPRVARMKSLAVHQVLLLLSLCTFTIGAFLQLQREPFGLSIFMEETVSR